MTVFRWCWLIRGFPMAFVLAVLFERAKNYAGGAWECGLVFLMVWAAAPFVAALGALFGMLAAVSWAVRRTAEGIPAAPSRDELLARIARLERDLEIAPRADEHDYPREPRP